MIGHLNARGMCPLCEGHRIWFCSEPVKKKSNLFVFLFHAANVYLYTECHTFQLRINHESQTTTTTTTLPDTYIYTAGSSQYSGKCLNDIHGAKCDITQCITYNLFDKCFCTWRPLDIKVGTIFFKQILHECLYQWHPSYAYNNWYIFTHLEKKRNLLGSFAY